MWSDKKRELEEYEADYISRLEKGTKTGRKKKTTKLIQDQKGAHWKNKNIDLKKLTDKMVDFFYADGFAEVRQEESTDKTQHVVQAKKAGALRTLSSTRKVITIVIRGNPNDFQVEVGTGEWGKGVAVAVVLTGLIGVVGLGFNAAFREKVWTNIKLAIRSLEDTTPTKSTTRSTSKESESNFCENCGKTLRPTTKFCGKCGTPVP